MKLDEFIGILISVAEADPNLAHAWISHFTFTEDLLRSPELLGIWGERIAAERLMIANAFVENGNDPLTIHSDNRLGTYVLNGEKYYCTGSVYCTHLQVFAELGGERVNVIVPADVPGVVVRDDWNGFGQRQSASGGVSFTAVRVRSEQILRMRESASPSGYLLAFSQLFLLAVLAGIARRAATDLVLWVRNKKSNFPHGLNKNPAEDPLVQAVVGGVISKADAAVALVMENARRLEQENHAGADDLTPMFMTVCASQTVVVELVEAATSQMFDIGGGSMISSQLGFDRHWRNAKAVACHNPTNLRLKDIGAWYLGDASSSPNSQGQAIR